MVHGFDIIAIGVEHECRIVSGVIGSFAGRAIITSAMGQRRAVEGIHRRAILGLEGQMVSSRQRTQCRRAFRRGHDEFISPEIAVRRATMGISSTARTAV